MGSWLGPSLTDLPDHVIEDILVHLPLREAVRTSVLSRAWRHRWQSIPDLVLDDRELPAAAIDNVLLLHSAPVRRFSLETFHAAHAHAHRWILSLSRSGSGHLLSLDISFDLYQSPLYPLHCSVFSFRETLTQLRLVHCSLSLPPHPPLLLPGPPLPPARGQRPPALRPHLRMTRPRAPPSHSPEALQEPPCPQPQPPLLGTLCRLRPPRDRERPDPARSIHRSGQRRHGRGTGRAVSGFRLRWPALPSWLYHGGTMMSLMIRSPPPSPSSFSIPRQSQALAKGSVPESMATSFQRLRSLSMSVSLVVPSWISVMLCLMRSAPNLQRLALVGLDYGCWSYADDATGPGEDFWTASQSLELFASLRTVYMMDIMIQEPDIEFMRFILARAQVLETLTISSPIETTRHHESALTELRKFPRTSTRAQIIYEQHEEGKAEG